MFGLKKYKISFEITGERKSSFDACELSLKGETYIQAHSGQEAYQIANMFYHGCKWDISEIESTRDLVYKIKEREAVQSIEVEPHVPIKIEVDGKAVQCEVKSGPCHILVVYD